jgi:hypothetical protein
MSYPNQTNAGISNDEPLTNLLVQKTSTLKGYVVTGRTVVTVTEATSATIGIDMIVNSSLVDVVSDGTLESGWTLVSLCGQLKNVIDGQTLTIYNRGGTTMTVAHLGVAVGASEQLKIQTPSAANVLVLAGHVASFVYNSGIAKWVLVNYY